VSELLERLLDPADGAPTQRLARLVVDDLLGRRLRDLVAPARVAEIGLEVAAEWLRSERAEARLLEAWQDAVGRVGEEERNAAGLAPEELRAAVEALVSQHYSIDRELMLLLIDRPPVRELFRDLLTETLTAFGRKLTEGGGGALGALGKLGGGLGRPKGGLLGRVGDVASAVGGEMERQLERRIPEFVDSGLSQIIVRFVDLVSDPSRAPEQAEIRLAILEGLWGLSGADLASEMQKLDAPATAKLIRGALSAWVARDGAAEQIGNWLEGLLSEFGSLSLGDVLTDLDLIDSFHEHGLGLAHRAALRLFATEDFARWFAHLESHA